MMRSTHLGTASLWLVACYLGVSAQHAPRDRSAEPSVGTAVISGAVVTDGPSPQPVRRANVTLNSVDGRGAAQTTATDDQGRFVFRDLPWSRYVLQASKRAWLDANYGATRQGRPGTPVLVAEGQRITDIVIKMSRGAVITGSVRDPNGEPLPGVNVSVLRFTMRNGQRLLAQTWLTSEAPVTDDTGTYRVFGLAPGEYVVSAIGNGRNTGQTVVGAREMTGDDVTRAEQLARQGSATPSTPAAPAGDGKPLVGYGPVFYPGTADISAASPLMLAAGEERTGIDLIYRPVPTARIEGTVTALPGTDRIEMRVALAGEQMLMGRLVLPSYRGLVDKDGHYFVTGVTPGHYVVMAVTSAPYAGPGSQGAPTGSTTLRLSACARAEIDVNGQDITLSLAMQPPLTMSGRVVFEGAAPPKDGAGVRVSIQPVGMGDMMALSPWRVIDEEKAFDFSSMLPGTYAMTVTAPAGGAWVVKSAVAGGRDLLDAPFSVREDMRDVVVTVTDHPSELAGTLQHPSGRPAPDYFILVLPVDKTGWTPASYRFRQTRPSTDGTFSVRGLPAGQYLLAALTDVDPDELMSPMFLEQVAAAGVKVVIGEGQKTTQDLVIR